MLKPHRIPLAARRFVACPVSLQGQARANDQRDLAFTLELQWQEGRTINRRQYLRACLAGGIRPTL